MLCRKCRTWNQENTVFCSRCGAPLNSIRKKPSSQQKRSIWIGVFSGALVLLICFFLLYFYVLPRLKGEGKRDEEKAALDSQPIPETQPPGQLPVGWVVIQNPWGTEVSRIPAAVVGGSWIALPTRMCYGGDKWVFRPGDPDEARIEGGIWTRGDPIGLWKLAEGKELDTPELFSWEENAPLEWLPLMSDSPSRFVKPYSYQKHNLFVYCSLPEEVNEPGVLIQNNRIVGWTFGKWLDRGFLWTGQTERALKIEIRVNHFYYVTFANGREDQFSRALAMGENSSALDRLNAFAEGFLLESRLSIEDTPIYLRPESAIKHMNSLIKELIQKGFSKEVVDILDDQIITAASNLDLFIYKAQALIKAYGYNDAVQFVERKKRHITEVSVHDTPRLNRFHAQLYKGWIRESILKSEFIFGWQAFDTAKVHFPDDVEIHLLGVELALAEGNLENAERLLHMRSYPQSLIDSFRALEEFISKQKYEAAKIVVYFTPGSKFIPVEAVLNDTLRQKFIIDTGASMVTIPSNAVDALGIVIDSNTPTRVVSTAGALGIVYEVMLDSIEMEGKKVFNINAFVVDMPGFPGVGLLGLNYLQKFHVEIDNKKGILVLTPREK